MRSKKHTIHLESLKVKIHQSNRARLHSQHTYRISSSLPSSTRKYSQKGIPASPKLKTRPMQPYKSHLPDRAPPSTGAQSREQISRTLGSSDHQKISISSHLSHSTQQEQHRPKPPLPEAPKNHAEQISTLQASGLKHMTWRWLVLFKNPGL